jgi:hypothetical protein
MMEISDCFSLQHLSNIASQGPSRFFHVRDQVGDENRLRYAERYTPLTSYKPI